MIRVRPENLIPGQRYTITRPGVNNAYRREATFVERFHHPAANIPSSIFRRNNGPTTALRDDHGWIYEKDIDREIMERNGALGEEHAAFRRQLANQLGPNAAARRLSNPALLAKLAMKRRDPLLKYKNTNLRRTEGGRRKTKRKSRK
jgi:hypothetical protein